jgi:hypothetical protein
MIKEVHTHIEPTLSLEKNGVWCCPSLDCFCASLIIISCLVLTVFSLEVLVVTSKHAQCVYPLCKLAHNIIKSHLPSVTLRALVLARVEASVCLCPL